MNVEPIKILLKEEEIKNYNILFLCESYGIAEKCAKLMGIKASINSIYWNPMVSIVDKNYLKEIIKDQTYPIIIDLYGDINLDLFEGYYSIYLDKE